MLPGSFQKVRPEGCKKLSQGGLLGLARLVGAPRLLSEIPVATAQGFFTDGGGEAPPQPGPAAPLSFPHFSTVKEKLRLDPDSEIATTGVRVSLICPVSWCASPPSSLHIMWGPSGLGSTRLEACSHPLPLQLVKMRLSVPCRAETCAHLQCFDAVFYLQMNEKKPTWMCPVCDKPAPYDQLIIDG